MYDIDLMRYTIGTLKSLQACCVLKHIFLKVKIEGLQPTDPLNDLEVILRGAGGPKLDG